MKVIIINGPMGVGKTVTGKLIAEKNPGTAFIDGDWCMDLHPFVGNHETKAMAIDNILHMIGNYQNMDGLDALQAEAKCVTLVCDQESLIRRWKNDHDCEWRTDQWLAVSLKSLPHFASMENTIDTSRLSADSVADLIMQ